MGDVRTWDANKNPVGVGDYVRPHAGYINGGTVTHIHNPHTINSSIVVTLELNSSNVTCISHKGK